MNYDLLNQLIKLVESNKRLQCDLEPLEVIEGFDFTDVSQCYEILKIYDNELIEKIIKDIPIYIVINTIQKVLRSNY